MRLIDADAAIEALVDKGQASTRYRLGEVWELNGQEIREVLNALPSAQPEQRYTEEELRVFAHGISLSLLSKRSAQHWRYDEDTATEIEFLERLYDKVSAHMKGIKAI